MEPSTAEIDWIEVIQVVELALFALFVVFGAVLTSWRFLRYKRAGQEPPFLLKLNTVERLSLAIPFAAILVSRVLIEAGFISAEAVRDQLWWVIFTGGLAILGAGAYAYAEAFLIERDRGDSDDAPPGEPPSESHLPGVT